MRVAVVFLLVAGVAAADSDLRRKVASLEAKLARLEEMEAKFARMEATMAMLDIEIFGGTEDNNGKVRVAEASHQTHGGAPFQHSEDDDTTSIAEEARQRRLTGSGDYVDLLYDGSSLNINANVNVTGYVQQNCVAFLVSLSASSGVGTINIGDVISWDTVRFNEGGGYDLSIDKFVAPTSGVYFFSCAVSASSIQSADAVISLYIDDVEYVSTVTTNNGGSGSSVASLSIAAPMFMTTGSTAYCTSIKDNLSLDDGGALQNSFSGFLTGAMQG